MKTIIRKLILPVLLATTSLNIATDLHGMKKNKKRKNEPAHPVFIEKKEKIIIDESRATIDDSKEETIKEYLFNSHKDLETIEIFYPLRIHKIFLLPTMANLP